MSTSDKDGWQVPSDYERLVKLEKLILASVEIAQRVCEELAQKTEHDNNKLLRLCETFSENIELAQMLILEATRKHWHHKEQSGDIYQHMNESQVFMEKIDTLKCFFGHMESCLRQSGQGDEEMTL